MVLTNGLRKSTRSPTFPLCFLPAHHPTPPFLAWYAFKPYHTTSAPPGVAGEGQVGLQRLVRGGAAHWLAPRSHPGGSEAAPHERQLDVLPVVDELEPAWVTNQVITLSISMDWTGSAASVQHMLRLGMSKRPHPLHIPPKYAAR